MLLITIALREVTQSDGEKRPLRSRLIPSSITENPDNESLRSIISGGTKLAFPVSGNPLTHLKKKTMNLITRNGGKSYGKQIRHSVGSFGFR
jgi:hypothetical protein